MSKAQIETIEFRALAPANKTNLKGLDDALTKLNALNAVWGSLQARMGSLSSPVVFKKTAADIREAIAAAEKLGRFGKGAGGSFKPASLKPAELAKALGYDAKMLENFLVQGLVGGKSKAAQEMRRQVREIYSAATGEFRSLAGAGKGIALFTKHFDPKQDPMAALRMVFGGAGPQAAVVPTVSFAERMAAAKAAKAAAAPAPAGEKESKEAVSKAKSFAKARSQIERELAEALNVAQGKPGQNITESVQKQIAAYRRAAAQMRGLVGGDTESKKANDALKWAANQERKSTALTQQEAVRAADNIGQTRKALAAARIAGDKAEELRLQKELKAQQDAERARVAGLRALDRAFYKPLEKQKEEAANRQRRVDERLAADRARDASYKAARQYEEDLKLRGAKVVGSGTGSKPYSVYEWDEGGLRRQARVSYHKDEARIAHRNLRPEKGTKDRLQSAMEGLSLRNMTANVLKVTEWAAAVGVLYKGLELAEYSLHRLIETGADVAHLSLVFRGVGGDVKALTNDIIHLAAMNGRNTEEALKSATAWARFGGDRATVNEQVRVSAMAANIANMTMHETTRQLMSLTHLYKLEAKDLNGTLGMLVNTTLTEAVTLEELFTGLDRSAASAKTAGVGLAELQATIGTLVAYTGQTGATIGNAQKYIYQELTKGETQKQLRGFGIETLGNNLEQKPAGQVLGELSGIWGTLGPRAQQQVSWLLGGRFNAARVPILLQEYPAILKHATDAQLNLNKAQDANVKIVETLKAQLNGLKTEFDRLVVSRGSGGLAEVARTGKNFLSWLNSGESRPGAPLDVLSASPEELYSTLQKDKVGRFGHRFSADSIREVKNELVRRDVAKAKKAGLDYWGGQKFAHFANTDSGNIGYSQYDWFNAWQEYAPGMMEDQSKLADLRKGNSVKGLLAARFNIGLARLRNGTLDQENANLVADAMQKAGASGQAIAFQKAYGQPGHSGAEQILLDVQKQNSIALAAGKESEMSMITSRMVELRSKSDELNKQIGDAQLAGRDMANDKEMQEWEKQIEANDKAVSKLGENLKKVGEEFQELQGDINEASEAMARFGGVMKAQEAVQTQIGNFFTTVSPVTQVQALTQEAAAAKSQLNSLLAAQEAFNRANPFVPGSPQNPAISGVNTWFTQAIQDARTRVDATGSQQRWGMAMRQDQMQRGIRGAEYFNTANDYGIDPAAKLLNQHNALKRDLEETTNRLRNAQPGSAEQAELLGRYEQEQTQLWQNKLALAERFAAVQRDIKQLAIDQSKEFMRAFYGDGPAQMLQKLAAFRMAFNPNGTRKSMSQGAFFGLSPEMRGDYGMLNTEYNPQMIELKRERERLKQAQDQWKNPQGPTMSEDVARIKAQLTRIPASFSDALLEIANDIKAQASPLIAAFNGVVARINAWTPAAAVPAVVTAGQPPANAQSGGFGGARGFGIPHRAPGVRTY